MPRASEFGGLELWCIDVNTTAGLLLDVEQKTPRLPERDRDFATTIADRSRANEWLAAHVALRILLERAVGPKWRGMPFERAAGVKPYLAGAPITFSLSHVSGCSLVGVGNKEPLGVDLERMRIVNIGAPRRIMLECAAEALPDAASLPDREDARVLQAWVRLEAFAKADGCGIGRLLTQLGIVGENCVQGDDLQARVDNIKRAVPPCVVHDLDIEKEIFAAAALPAGTQHPNIFKFPSSAKGINELLA